VPITTVNDIEINYQVQGAGDPVVLLGGLGADMFLWFRQIPELSKSFQVIAFDSRGAGESGKPDEPYSIEMFAADTVGLLDHLGIGRAHIVGASLGSLIALELALSYPDRINRLVLVASTPKRPRPRLRDFPAILLAMRRSGDPAIDIRRSFKLFTTAEWFETHGDLVQQYVDWRVAHPQPPFAYKRQQESTMIYNAEERVGQITAPALIVHGTEDRVVPLKYAQWLADHIPDATLALIRAGHAINIEQDAWFNRTVTEFLNG